MRIQFFGATRTTTGSAYRLEINGLRLLLECGLFQGRRGESIERNRNFPFNPKELDAVVLSHAHIVEAIGGDIKKIAVIHGEESQALAFGETLRALKPKAEVLVPEYQDVMEV